MKNGKLIIVICLLVLGIAFYHYHVVYAKEVDDYYSTVDEALNNVEQNLRLPSEEGPQKQITSPDEGEDMPLDVVVDADFLDSDTEEFAIIGENTQVAETEQPVDEVETDEEPQAGPERIIVDVLELKDMEIADVLKLLSKKSGLNIVAGRNVKGKVTIYLKDVDVRDALRIILESNDMAYVEEDDIIRVMTSKDYEMTYGRKFSEKTELKIVQLKYASAADAAALLNQMKSIIGKTIADDKSNTIVIIDTADKLSTMEMFLQEIDVPIMTKVFRLNYAEAESLSGKIGEVLTKNVGSVRFDERSNKLVVTDTPQKMEEIGRMIEAFDEQHKEVLIEAKILQIVLSDQYKLGVDWEAIVSDYHSLDLTGNFDILSSSDKSGTVSVGTISNDDYTALVEALEAVGTTNILSSPRITTVNNEEAKILVGSTEPYVTTTTTTPATGATTTAESVNFIEVGVKLYVTPTIHSDDYITMKIKPEVSSVTRYLTTSNNNTIPIVETSEAETTVMVKDDVTIVIGGLIKDEIIETVNKVPLFGDIPLIGFAFRNKDSLVRKTETVIFLTPKIVTGDVSTRDLPD